MRIGRYCRRLRKSTANPAPKTIYEEMEQGAVIGFLACIALAAYLSAGDISASLLVFFASLGVFTGGVIGALLWIGSASLPEEPVRAPPPGQGRKRRPRT